MSVMMMIEIKGKEGIRKNKNIGTIRWTTAVKFIKVKCKEKTLILHVQVYYMKDCWPITKNMYKQVIVKTEA
jgi:hypothetical protein